jgi:type IV pilus assembly protein PilC
VRKAILSRALRTLATMIHSGVSMIESLKLAAQVSGNVLYAEAWGRVLDDVTQGKKICDSLQKEPLFPKSLVQMVSAGEESGKLDKVLHKVSEYYDRELEITIKTTTAMIEPLMILTMGCIVGGIAMSLLLPIFQLSKPV